MSPNESSRESTSNPSGGNSRDSLRYAVLRDLALSGIRAQGLENTVQGALRQTAELVGLGGLSVFLWGEDRSVRLQVTYAVDDAASTRLSELETSLFRRLRDEDDLVAAYITLGGSAPCHSFTLPLQYGKEIFGAVIGVQFGERTVVEEDLFLETLSATIALHSLVAGPMLEPSGDRIEKERLGAILETAVTVNHEINNPLTAILGNVQLLLLKRDDLDDELRKKLEVVETAATKIKDVTQRLMNLTSARSVGYTDGTTMIDISDRSDEKTRDK